MKDDDPTLQLDLRRMNRILEIDEKNLYAVVEPYVIHAQLQAEVLKRGLNINITGAGCSSSIVASACAYAGQGPYAYFMGGNSENLLGMEWVTPEGEIVRTGSLGSGDGWFCGEGPGPSVRGICRGAIGSRGGLGVYTKCAIKLGPSLGSSEWQVGGTLPAYRLPVAETQRVYTLAVPSWDAWADAYYEIYDNEIGYIFHRQFNLAGADLAPAFWLMYNDHTKTLSDVPELAARPDVQELTEEMRISLPAHPGRPLAGRHRAAGPHPRRDPRGGRRLEGRALLRAGHGRVHQHVPAAARPQAHQLRLGRRLHRQLDAVRHAGLGQGLRADRPPRASSATPPAASSCSAAATP